MTMLARRRTAFLLCFTVICVVVCLVAQRSWRIQPTVKTYNILGPLQIIAADEEMYVFLQVDSYSPDQSRAISAIRRKTGQAQALTRIHSDGICETIAIALPDGPSFNCNFSYISRDHGEIYLFQPASAESRESLFVWDNHRFRVLSDRRRSAVLDRSPLIRFPHWEVDEAKLPADHHRPLVTAEKNPLLPIEFHWCNRTVEIRRTKIDGSVELLVRVQDDATNSWEMRLIRYPVQGSLSSVEFTR